MKKRGFTLVELLGVLVLLGIIAMITLPIVLKSFKKTANGLSTQQINSLEEIAHSWGISNIDKLSEATPYYLTIDELKHSGLVENKDVVDPDTNNEIDGCIKIEYNSSKKQYEYNYKVANECIS